MQAIGRIDWKQNLPVNQVPSGASESYKTTLAATQTPRPQPTDRRAAAYDEPSERERIIAQCIIFIYQAYDRELPGETEMAMKIQTWQMALVDIPAFEIKDLVTKEIQHRTSEFMPVPADILKRWKGDDDEVTIANASAYLPLKPTANELAYREHKALTEGDSEGRKRFLELAPKLSAELNKKSQKFLGDRELLSTLHLQCDMASQLDVKPELRKAMLAFGRWLLDREPNTKVWHKSMAREYWNQWQAEQKQTPAVAQ